MEVIKTLEPEELLTALRNIQNPPNLNLTQIIDGVKVGDKILKSVVGVSHPVGYNDLVIDCDPTLGIRGLNRESYLRIAKMFPRRTWDDPYNKIFDVYFSEGTPNGSGYSINLSRLIELGHGECVETNIVIALLLQNNGLRPLIIKTHTFYEGQWDPHLFNVAEHEGSIQIFDLSIPTLGRVTGASLYEHQGCDLVEVKYKNKILDRGAAYLLRLPNGTF